MKRILLYVSKAQDSVSTEYFLPLHHRITDLSAHFSLRLSEAAAGQAALWSSVIPDVFCCFAKSHLQLRPSKSQLALTGGGIFYKNKEKRWLAEPRTAVWDSCLVPHQNPAWQ